MANFAKSGTLAANIVTSVTVQSWGWGVWVINRSQSGQIWVRLDGTVPTVAGDDNFVVMGARNFPTHSGLVTVQMISSGTPDWTVEAAQPPGVTS